jgi:hypothetical protein
VAVLGGFVILFSSEIFCSSFGIAFFLLNVLSFWEERTKETLRPDFFALIAANK